jgi:hypothetical protein
MLTLSEYLFIIDRKKTLKSSKLPFENIKNIEFSTKEEI